MSDDIKELVKKLRAQGKKNYGLYAEVADALEALLEERDRLKDEVERLRNEKVGTHGTPELDDDARKLEAMGQDPGMTLEVLLAPATDPAPAVCEWTRTPYTALYSSCCDEDYLRNVTDSGMCHRCGLPIKFTEAKE